jgi:hypothetical protein
MDRIIVICMLLSEKGIGPTNDRVKAVTDAREPETPAELHRFLGLISYSSRFISQFPADASPVGLGAVLTHVQHGNDVPICYASRSLTACERRYFQTEREKQAKINKGGK